METRTFRAPNLLKALQSIQTELGPQAIVVSMRKIPTGPAWQVWKKSGFEVMASLPEDKKEIVPGEVNTGQKSRVIQPVEKQYSGINSGVHATEKAADAKLAAEKTTTAWLVKEIASKAEVKAAPEQSEKLPVEKSQPDLPDEKSQLGKACRRLLDQGVADKVVKKITTVCLQTLNPGALTDPQKLTMHVKKLLESNLHSSQKLSMGFGQVICLVGTNGSGKTSACAKLAAYYRHVEGKNVVWIGADTVRTAAISEARIYSDSLGVSFQPVYTTQELDEAVTQSGVDIFLVDLPGINPRDEKSLVELGSLLTNLKRRITYLVISATTKDKDLQQTSAALGAFNLDGVLVTKMDETGSLGNIYNFALLSQLPLVWFAKGKNTMEDFEPGNPKQLVSVLLGEGGF
ncbi:MAG TPA: hypothetical protein VMS73_05155 [Anaerolineaceae bacterium]|nr:hypothetical protein [Anaerolineaceae bacterium]